MNVEDELEKEKTDGHFGYIMIKGDLGREVTKNDPSIVPDNPKAEEKIRRWLTTSLEEYAGQVCGVRIEVLQTKIIKGFSEEQLIELYGEEHGAWMDGLSEGDFEKQMEVFDGTMAPIILATVKVDGTTNASEAEVKLIKIRDALRSDWHEYLGRKEVRLPGGSTMFLSAIHIGNYEKDRKLLNKLGFT